jgi:hypothetical protein
MQVGGKIARSARTKQDNGQVAGQWMCRSLGKAAPAEYAAQRHSLGIRKDDFLGVQTKVCRHLVAVSVRKKNERIQ